MPGYNKSFKSYKTLYTFLNKYGFKKGQALPSRLESKNNKIWIYLTHLGIGFFTKDEDDTYNKSLQTLRLPDEISDISYEAKVSSMKKFLKDNIRMMLEYDENPSNALYNKIKNAWNSFDWSVPTKASANKVFAYHGQTITAGSKQEAIKRIAANNKYIYYKIDVPGHYGYSFMVKTIGEKGEGEIINLCLKKNLFNDRTDARYASVDDMVDERDIKFFKNSTYEI